MTTPFKLTEKVTLYAPANARHHKEGEEIKVGVLVAEKLIKQGYSKSKPQPETKSKKVAQE